ncbi:MAG: cupin domain-containing protein [Bryobacterales bacterium]|jgi:quercetin dioxygenase-like cupin family protein|nr:cupin domain-containing protein [Bryobacterales bacterium]
MKTLLVWLLLAALPLAARDPLAKRIVRTDPTQYRQIRAVHGGAGELHYQGLVDGYAMGSSLLFLHRGVIPPGGGIGHHFHNQMEEMFVILDNEAEFTVNGRTSRIEGPAGAPCRMGSSHAIYNPTDRPTQWMNIAVSRVKGRYDAFDLGDDRVGVAKDKIPVFITMRLDRKLLKPVERMNGGQGTAQYRRTLQPEVFYTNWAYMDHVLLPPGASVGRHRHVGVEELHYVMKGAGQFQLEKDSETIREGDAIPVLFNEVHGFENAGTEPLEIMIIGVSRIKESVDTVDVP